MTLTAQSLLAELDLALARATDPWRRKVLRQVTDLFLGAAEHCTENEVAVFDDVMCRLIHDGDLDMLVELANALAPVHNAPANVVGNLARHSSVAVHGPILEQATALPEQVLIEIADKDQRDPILTKIAARPRLSAAVTDVLLKRADKKTQRTIIANPNARVSEASFARLIMSLKGDKEFAAAIAARADLPPELRPFVAAVLQR
jgi:uncharacterized protein (DUF2336 family)